MPKRKAENEVKRDEEEEQPEVQPAEDNEPKDSGDVHEDSDDSDESGSGGEDEGDEQSDEDDEGDSEDSFPEASSSEAESEDDDEGEAYKEVDVQFEFFDPQERDFLGLKALLGTYLDGQQYDSSGLVDAIIKQTAVGTVVKSSAEDDPFALLTAFNTTCGRHVTNSWMLQLREYLTARCPDTATRNKLSEVFSGSGTGLLVSERLINCPPQLAPPMMQMLMEEIEGAATDEDYPQEERQEFTFARYLHFTRVYTDPEEGDGNEAEAVREGAAPSASRPGTAAGKTKSKSKEPLIVYVRPEDEYLHQVCSWSFTFPVEGRPVAKGDLQPLRAVMCIEAGKVEEARAMLNAVVGNMMEEGQGAGNKGGKGGPVQARGERNGKAGGSGTGK